MTAPADRSGRVTRRPCPAQATTDHGQTSPRSAGFPDPGPRDADLPDVGLGNAGLTGSGLAGSGLTDAELVDAEFASIVARNGDPDDGATAMPSAERCERTGGSTALRDQIGRIASAVFCTSGMDVQLLDFAIRRVAEHHDVDGAQVADRIADGVLQIAVALAPGR